MAQNFRLKVLNQSDSDAFYFATQDSIDRSDFSYTTQNLTDLTERSNNDPD